MAWKYGERTLRVNKGWTDDDGTQHPSQWVTWTAERKTAKGCLLYTSPSPRD